MFLGGNPPFQPMVSVSAGQTDNPGAGEATGFPQFFMTQDPVYRIPASYMWNISFQPEVGFKTLLEVGYVGRTATRMERVRDINQLPQGSLLRPELKGVNPNYLRPYKGFANIIFGENAARSEYNGLQFNLTRRFSDGLSFGAAYTYSSSWDNADNRRDRVWNSADDRNFWGPADYDVGHALVVNWVYEVPLMRNSSNAVAKAVVGGWTISGVMQYQTGFPGTVGRNSDYAGIGDNSFQPWEVSGDPTLSRGQRGFSQGRGGDVYFFQTKDSSGKPGSVCVSPHETTICQHLARDVYHLVCPKVGNRLTRWGYDRNGDLELGRSTMDELRSMAFDHLVGERDAEGHRREGVEVLRRNPDMVAAFADSLESGASTRQS